MAPVFAIALSVRLSTYTDGRKIILVLDIDFGGVVEVNVIEALNAFNKGSTRFRLKLIDNRLTGSHATTKAACGQ